MENGDGSGKRVIINFGEGDLVTAQINRQLFDDSRWAILSLVLAAVMLRIGSQSTFLTVCGVIMLLLTFPIAWLLYAAPRGWQTINFIHFLAPFVVLGIGLDDIFVCTSLFGAARPYAAHFALDTRLTLTMARASSATLATSTTSAFAFVRARAFAVLCSALHRSANCFSKCKPHLSLCARSRSCLLFLLCRGSQRSWL